MKVKAATIARDLGLSKATVSLALNHKPGVSEETKKLIFNYIDQVENGITTSKVIKIVNYARKQIDPTTTEVDLWTNTLAMFNKEAKKDGYLLSIDYIEDDLIEIEKLVIEYRQPLIAGIIIFANEMDKETFNLFKQINKPTIIYDNDYQDDHYSYVMIDNYHGLEEIIKLIKSKGFKQIGYLANQDNTFNFQKRREAFKTLITKYQLDGKIYITGNSVDTSYSVIKEGLENNLYPRVLISENYQISISAIKAFQDLQLELKKDVHLAGIDEIPNYFCYGYNLTVLKIAHSKRAKLAMMLLKDEIEQNDLQKFRVYSTCKLIIGDTL